MALLRNYFEETYQDSPILYVITAEMVQNVVESNLRRRLSKKEIERMHYSMLENNSELIEFILYCAEDAMCNKGGVWSEVDADYEKRKRLYSLGKYSIGKN